jgi:hypothetical protein
MSRRQAYLDTLYIHMGMTFRGFRWLGVRFEVEWTPYLIVDSSLLLIVHRLGSLYSLQFPFSINSHWTFQLPFGAHRRADCVFLSSSICSPDNHPGCVQVSVFDVSDNVDILDVHVVTISKYLQALEGNLLFQRRRIKRMRRASLCHCLRGFWLIPHCFSASYTLHCVIRVRQDCCICAVE